MADLVSHQGIEDAFKPAKDILGKLPEDTTEAKRAAHHLKLAEDYAHETRDRTKTDRVADAEIDASVEMRINYHAVVTALIKPEYLSFACPTHGHECRANNAQIPGWPFKGPTARWARTDGSAP